MKRWMWILSGLLAVQLLGETGVALENLKPVQLLLVEKQENRILLKTDLGDLGRGETVEEALRDMEMRAEGKIFLETAEQLVLTEDTVMLWQELMSSLRPATRVCLGKGEIDPAEAAAYLSYHKGEVTLGRLRADHRKLPVLYAVKGGMKLVDPR